MYKVVRSFSRKAERKHESSGSAAQTGGGTVVANGTSYGGFMNGSARQADAGFYGSSGGQHQHHQQTQQQHQQLAVANGGATWGGGFSESSSYETREHYERKVQRVKKTRSERERSRSARGANGHQVSEVLSRADTGSARDALLEWARRVTAGYQGVNVNNFTSSWRDGLAFNAILHRYRPNLINWNKISDRSVSARERLDNAFEAAERGFGVVRLLDPEDVDTDKPDEKSIITYVSSLYNALPNLDELAKGNLDDILSRLDRGIGITNEKLDHILNRIEDTVEKADKLSPSEIERRVAQINDDLIGLDIPIGDLEGDVNILNETGHSRYNEYYRQVLGLRQRQDAYLDRLRNQLLVRLDHRSQMLQRESSEHAQRGQDVLLNIEECIEWVKKRLHKLNEMEFTTDLEEMEQIYEEHKIDNHEIQDYRHVVDRCIAAQHQLTDNQTHESYELLCILESDYQQLRDLSAGRILDLDSLIAFMRAAQMELVWIREREDVEVHRNWSDINQLDLPMLRNYYQQLTHDIEQREKRFNDVYNQGAALLNQHHPAVNVIDSYLQNMKSQWDWLLSLTVCLDGHLRDANNLHEWMEDAGRFEENIRSQMQILENNYNRTDFSVEEGGKMLHELDHLYSLIKENEKVLESLTQRAQNISPLWQRGERISRPMPVTAWCNYVDGNVNIRTGDECTLLDNSDLIYWDVRCVDGVQARVPSVVFRIPPPDGRLTAYLSRLLSQYEQLRKLWEKKNRMVRLNMVLNTMKTIRGWDLDTFNSMDPDHRDAIIRALNEDANKLLSELDPNDPLALRLREELRLTNEHFYDLLNRSKREPEPDYSNEFDQRIAELLRKLEEAWKKLNDHVGQAVPKNADELSRVIAEHKNFEEALQALDVDVSEVKELFRQLPNPTPNQRAAHDTLNGRWEDLWDLSHMYVERLRALEGVLNGMAEVSDIVRQHEITLNSFDDMPAALDRLRGVHSQLLEMNMVLQQQQAIVDALNHNVALLRQHVARTRFNVSSHPDVDRLEEETQRLTVRWENVCSQVVDRLKAAEQALQTQMVYRSGYENEIAWLDRVEATINSLRHPEDMQPEQYQQQLDLLVAEYAQLQERTEAIEGVNREGGKFIREAKGYDSKMHQFHDNVTGIHGHGIANEFRRSVPQPQNGAEQVTEELEKLNRRFAQLSSLILERRNIISVLIQKWKQKQQDDLHKECLLNQQNISGLLQELSNLDLTHHEAAQQLSTSKGTTDSTTSARMQMQSVREELAQWGMRISESVREADRLCEEGADMLTPEQFHELKENRDRLKATYQTMVSKTDAILERLNVATSMLIEFSNESSSMHSWINDRTRHVSRIRMESGDPNRLEEANERIQDFTEEVAFKEETVDSIANLAKQIENEIALYLNEMHQLHPSLQQPPMDCNDISNTVQRLRNDYIELRNGCLELVKFVKNLQALSTDHKNTIRDADSLLRDLEQEVLQNERSSGDEESAEMVQRRLDKMMALGERTRQHHSDLGTFEQVSDQLVKAVANTDAYNRIALEQSQLLGEMRRRHSRLDDRIQRNVDDLKMEMEKIDQMSVTAEQTQLKADLENVISEARELALQLAGQPPISADPQKLGEQLDVFEKFYSNVLAKEDDVMLMRAKVLDQLKRCPDSELREELEQEVSQLAAEWNPLMQGTKDRKTLMEKVKRLADEMAEAQKAAKEAVNRDAKTLDAAKTATDDVETEIGNIAALEEVIQAKKPQIEALKHLGAKLEMLAPGPDANRTCRALENIADDWERLLKDCKDAGRNAQRKNKLRLDFEKSVRDAEQLLGAYRAHELFVACKNDEPESLAEAILNDPGNEIMSKDTVKSVLAGLEQTWSRQNREVVSTGNELRTVADADLNREIDEIVADLDQNASNLLAILLNALKAFDAKEGAITSFRQKLDSFDDEVTVMRDQVKSLGSIGRDPAVLDQQYKKCEAINEELEKKEDELKMLAIEWKKLAESSDKTLAAKVLKDLERISSELEHERGVIAKRKRSVSATKKNVEDLLNDVALCSGALQRLLDDPAMQEQPIGTADLNELREQQEALRLFKDQLKSQKDVVSDVTARCKEMIRSAGPDTSTSDLEDELRKIDDSWNAVASAAEERDRLIDGAIQHLGGYNDAHRALTNWLEEMEDMMNNLAPPSADHKVVKTQLQNYEFQRKLIEDKKASVDGFAAMIGNIERLSGEGEQRPLLRAKAHEVKTRYDDLVEKADDRRSQLFEAATLTDQWQKLANPLKAWLESCDKSLQALGNVPVNTEQCEALLAAQEKLHSDLESKRERFDELVALCLQITELVGVEDANELEATLRSLTSGYNQIGVCSKKCGTTLENMRENLKEFQEDANEFSGFLDEINGALGKLGDVSTDLDELAQQSEEICKIAEELSCRDQVVMKLVEDTRELCKHTSGSEALSLHSRIDGIRNRYMELTTSTDQKMAVLAEAVDLSDEFHSGHDSLLELVEGFETDLAHLDSISLEQQNQLVGNMDADLERLRPEVDLLNAKSKQLQQLASASRGEELSSKTLEMNRRFNNVVSAVGRKSERLRVAELQSRQVFDDLDFLLDWFNEAHERIEKSSKPSIESKSLIHQIEGQRLMNQDIKLQKDDLRKVIADASAVARHLNDVENGGQDALIHEKIENAQKLSEDTSRMAEERLGVLEEAEMLVSNLDDHYGNLLDWLEDMEAEMREAPLIHIGSRPDQLLNEQQINQGQKAAIQSQRAIIEEFEQNAATLARLCNEEDAGNLDTIAGQIVDRFNSITDQVRARGQGIDEALEQSSKFTDRLDSLLSNLESTAGQIRNASPISSRPKILLRQISDNDAVIDSLRQKHSALETMQNNAAEIIAQAKPNDPAVIDISNKLHRLEELCFEIEQGSATRGAQLQDTLVKAERFWREYEQCLEAVDSLRKRLEAIEPNAGGSPEHLQGQKEKLVEIDAQMVSAEPVLESMKGAGRDLCKSVGGDEGVQIAQQIGIIESDWGTVTQLFAQREKDLVDAIEKSMQFHDLLTDLVAWMDRAEKTIDEMPPLTSGVSVDEIRDEMERIGALRKDADEHAVLKEQLNQSANQLCASAQPHQAAAIRAPISDLNNRWHRLYGQLNDRQQKLERGLLEMGQFNQAYEQLLSWINQTEKTLDEIQPQPGNLKLIEIELCKHRVVQNDVDSHQPSFETLNNAGQYLIKADPASSATTQPKLDELNERWHYLADRLNELWASLQAARNEAANMGDQTEKWIMWLSDVDADLAHSKPIGGLPETAITQYDDFLVTKAEVESRRGDIEKHLTSGEAYLTGDMAADSWFGQKHSQLKKLWTKVQERLVDRENKLQIALKDAEQLSESMENVGTWIDAAESRLNQQGHVSRVPDGIDRQMKDHTEFQKSVQEERAVLSELANKAGKIQLACEKKDAIPIKNRMVSLKHRFDKVQSRCADRTKALDSTFNDVRLFFDAHADLLDWIEENAGKLAEQETSPVSTGDRIRQELEEHTVFARELADLQPKYDSTERRGKALQEHAPQHEKPAIGAANEDLRQKWTSLCAASVQRKRALEDALAQSGKFDEALTSLTDWLEVVLPQVGQTEKLKGDIDTVKRLFNEHEAVNDEIQGRRKGIERVRERAKLMLEATGSGDAEGMTDVQEKLVNLNQNWDKLEHAAKEKDKKLNEALASAEHFEDLVHSVLEWLCDLDTKIRSTANGQAESEAEIIVQIGHLEQLHNELEANRPKREDAIHVGEEILVDVHSDAEVPMRNYIRIITARWDEVERTAAERAEKLKKELDAIKAHNALVNDLIQFIYQQDDVLKSKAEDEDPDSLDVLDNLMKSHELFKFELQEKQPEVDESVKFQKKIGGNARNESETEGAKKAGIGAKKRGGVKNKCEHMNDRWKKLWVDTMGYEQRLRARKEYLEELERLKGFTFDDWRERYLEWNDHAKARVSDLFRRIDKLGTGNVSRKVFIDGIIASKFPTTLLEMERVADVFDKGDGMISSKEFMEALRFDPRKKHSVSHKKSDKERVDEEIVRQSTRCTCQNRFPIQFISSNGGDQQFQYSFGANTVKRMVRILRSTVMVRVGGGWDALDDFLIKHDPCRAKGRTNISLFYSDVRPSNAIDSMEEFTMRSNRGTPVRQSTPSGSGIQTTPVSRLGGTPGPIMKVREKTERSMRMFPSSGSASRGPPSRGTPTPSGSRKSSTTTPVSTSRRSSDVNGDDFYSRLARPTSASGSRSNLLDSRDSRPQSRCSDISESSERPTRIPSLRGRKGVRYNGTPSPASPQPWKN